MSAELILHNAKIATNGVPSFVEAIAITAGRISAAGKDEEILRLRGPQTRVILLSAPAATNYYPHIGFKQHPSAWMLAGDDVVR